MKDDALQLLRDQPDPTLPESRNPEPGIPSCQFQQERRTVGTQLAKGSALISRVGASLCLRWATTGGRPYGNTKTRTKFTFVRHNGCTVNRSLGKPSGSFTVSQALPDLNDDRGQLRDFLNRVVRARLKQTV
jgi:hypothetical protein